MDLHRYSRKLIIHFLIIIFFTGTLLGFYNEPVVAAFTDWPEEGTSTLSWTSFDTDPNESGGDDDRDVRETFLAMDTEYLYLRMRIEQNAGWSGTGRHKVPS